MKRSEMVEQISIELRDIIQEDYIGQKGFTWSADLILLRLEELGMWAPAWKEKIKDFPYETLNRTWEPEENE